MTQHAAQLISMHSKIRSAVLLVIAAYSGQQYSMQSAAAQPTATADNLVAVVACPTHHVAYVQESAVQLTTMLVLIYQGHLTVYNFSVTAYSKYVGLLVITPSGVNVTPSSRTD